MGVIYKLIDKVIDFIIAQKKENPHLGCRSLAAVAKKKFKINLSKSSINSILKQSGLSSPVGRRPKPEQKQPIILKQKVIELLETKPPPIGQEPLLPSEKPLLVEVAKKASEEQPKQPVEPEKKPEIPLQPPKELPPQPIEIQYVKKEEPVFEELNNTQLIEIKEDETIQNLGFFFLKSVEWQVSGGSLLAEAIKPYLPNYNQKDLEAKSEVLLYLTAFGIDDPERVAYYENKDIWVINQLERSHSPESLYKFVEDFKAVKSLSLALMMVGNRVVSEVGFLKLTLADNTVLFIDGQFKTIWQDPDIPTLLSSTVNKSMSYVKNLFQDNVQSVNLFTVPGYYGFSSGFYDFVYACEDLPQKRILRVSLHNEHKDEISTPIKLPPQKRFFIMGFWPWQEEGSRFIQEDVRIVKSFFFEDFGKEIFYSEIKSNLPQYKSFQGVKARIALIRDTGLGWPRMGILTNLPDEKPIEEIISEYLRRWPNLDEGYQDFLKKSEKTILTPAKAWVFNKPGQIPAPSNVYTISSAKMDLWQNLTSFVGNLSTFCQKHFFPSGYENVDFSTMKHRFYSLPGRLKRQDSRLLISLALSPGYAFQKDLLYAVRRVNESDVQTPFGQKIWLKIQ